jgi:hypothetical protein
LSVVSEALSNRRADRTCSAHTLQIFGNKIPLFNLLPHWRTPLTIREER